MTKVLVLHSGGLDSSVCLAAAVDEYGPHNCKSLSIGYGQRHFKEVFYAEQLCKHLDVERELIQLPPIKE